MASISGDWRLSTSQVAYQKDYYAILQVNRNAKQEDIEKAYKRLSTTYDPSTSNKKRAAQRHADVADAYAVLRDPRRRRQYDRQLANDLASAGSMRPADVLSNRFVLLGSGIIFTTVLVILGLVLLLGGGGSSDIVANVSPTASPAATPTPVPTPTPFGQTPAPTPPPSPPTITGASTTLTDGLQYTIFQEGSGNTTAATGDSVTVNYSGWVQATGALFDSSLNPGRTPFTVQLGAGKVIKGWDEGLVGMKIGEKRRLIIPPTLGYGANANGPIPANSTLTFDVELLSATPTTPTPVATATP